MLKNARTRLILASVALSVGVAALLLTGVYISANSIVEGETRSVVQAELTGLSDDYGRLGVPGLAAAIDRRVNSSDRRDAIYLLADARGQALAGNLAAWPPTIAPGSGWVELELIRTDSEKTVPVSAASLRLLGGERLLVGRDATARKLFNAAFFQSAIWALLFALGLSVVTGWLLTKLVFNRILDISRAADTIMSGALERRIPMSGTGDELDQLSQTLNEMLERISELIENLTLTTTSLSHDMRSPLTRIRSQLETLAVDGTDNDTRAATAQGLLSEVDHLLKVFDNLTEIARAETRLSRDDFDPVDLVALMKDAIELYEPVALEKHITFAQNGTAPPVPGHRQLLMQATSNLIENALRFSPRGSSIVLSLKTVNGYVEYSICDTGSGVPDAFLDQAIKPFATLDHSRTQGGSGLGLALVSAVARLHNGEVWLKNTTPGLCATLRLQAT
ncbi:MAG: HAMP domain-containing sensor histidine kinase [Pseudomonadota bacterium]